MLRFPKPRGFWDYALSATVVTGLLVFLFWLESSNGVGWLDGVVAVAAGVLFVLGVILARQNENATWMARPTWRTYALGIFACAALMLGAEYADAYLLHRGNFTSGRLLDDAVTIVIVSAALIWSWQKRVTASR